jgi:1,2-diacylglycerol 3-alpha-glucosyltransferase
MHNLETKALTRSSLLRPEVVVIWIDWYAYHVARFRGLNSASALTGRVVGLELVGGIGVHAGLKFREPLPQDLAIETIEADTSWREANKLSLALKLWVRLSELKPKVVLVPGYYTLPGIAAALWARLHGAASVLMTESCAFDHKRSPWKEFVKRLGLHLLFDWAVAGGKAHVFYLKQLGFPEERVAGFYDVVDNELFRGGTFALRTQEEQCLECCTFLYVGRLAPEKNVAMLLESWISYRAHGGTWSLALVGDGPESADLKARAGGCVYAQEVSFPGLKSSHELLPFYASAGCFVLPSTREPWGLVVNEAMASSLPVLVSDRCGCASELVEQGRNGYLFDPEDCSGLTALLHQIEDLTPEEHGRMSRASGEIICRFTPQKFGLAIASIAAARRNHKRSLLPATGGNR